MGLSIETLVFGSGCHRPTQKAGEPMKETNEGGELKLLTVSEVADILRISKSLVYDHVESGRLSACRLGKGQGAIRVRAADVEAFVDENQIQKPSGAVPRRPRRKEKLKHIKL